MGSQVHPIKVAIVVTSTRALRVGPKVGDWVKSVVDGYKEKEAEYELVDVADYKLPVFDEPLHPAMVPHMGEHVHEHSKRWSAKMSSYGGYVFVTPEYNYGMAGSTKNAIDFLYNEIINKPALIITYGIHGGKHSSEALKTTLEGMKLRVAKTRPALPFYGGRGPDMFAAAKGELGGDTKNDWEKEKKGEVEQGLKELEELLREEVTPRKEGES